MRRNPWASLLALLRRHSEKTWDERQPFEVSGDVSVFLGGDNMYNQPAFYCWDILDLKMVPSVSHFHKMIKQWMEWGAIFRQARPEKL